MPRSQEPGAAKAVAPDLALVKDEKDTKEYDMSQLGQEQARLPALSAVKDEIEEPGFLHKLWMQESWGASQKNENQTERKTSIKSAKTAKSIPEHSDTKQILTHGLFNPKVVLIDCRAELQQSGRYCQERKKKFKCDQCDKSFTLHNNYLVHLKLHSGVKNYKCHLCSYKTTRSDTLNDHVKTHTGEQKFKCNHCDYRCNKSSNFKRHARTHTGEKPYKCELCEYRCADRSALLSHRRNRHKEKNKNSKPHEDSKTKPNPCGFCKFRGVNKNELRIHLRIHTGEKPFKCDLCDYRCTRKQHLKTHAAVHSNHSIKQCSRCDVTYRTEKQLMEHMKIHKEIQTKTEIENERDEKYFKCSLCEYKNKCNWHLKNHFTIHTGEKPYECDKCEYRCARKASLQIHMRKHGGPGTQKYKCHCGFMTNYEMTLKKHLKSQCGNICRASLRPELE